MSAILTSGEVTTSTDSAVTAIGDTSQLEGGRLTGRHIEVINSGGADGFYSFDDGATWVFIPAGGSAVKDNVTLGGNVQIKRIAGGANMTGVHVAVW